MPERLHAELSGPPDGPPVLLGGSLGSDAGMWERQAPLAARHRLIAFDHRGHGRSPVAPPPYEIGDLGADVLAVMDRLGIARAAYVGLSLGGMVGIWLAAHAPERVTKLVLVCTAAYLPPPAAWRERAAAVLDAGSPEPIADAVVDRWLTPGGAAREPGVRARLRATLAATDATAYAACCGAIERMDLRGDLGRIAAPTLVVSGAEDQAAPLARQAEIAAGIPDARHEVIPHAAHLAAVEQPAAVNQLIGAFLGG